MEAKELRIGSLMLIDNEKYHPKLKNIPLEVTAITQNLDSSGWTYSISLKHINQKPNTYYETYSQFIKWVKPIPLTEEWLLKLGFENNKSEKNFIIVSDQTNDGLFTGHHSMRYIESEFEEDEGWFYNNDDTSAQCYTIAKLQYVHQLQNLYFALTGTELTIK